VGAVGNSQGIDLVTDTLILLDGGQVNADVEGAGIGGDVNVTAQSEIFASGSSINLSLLDQFLSQENPDQALRTAFRTGEIEEEVSGIFSELDDTGTGIAGAINVATGQLTLLGGARIENSISGVGGLVASPLPPRKRSI
jgi:hypothetical protein